MSKDLIRLIIVIAVIAIATIVVIMLTNKTDNGEKLYNKIDSFMYGSQMNEVNYFTKTLNNSSTPDKNVLSSSAELQTQYEVYCALNSNLEYLMMHAKFASNVKDTSTYKQLNSAFAKYKKEFESSMGIISSAKKLYNYLNQSNNEEYKAFYIENTINAMKSCIRKQIDLTLALDSYVDRYSFNNNVNYSIENVLYDMQLQQLNFAYKSEISKEDYNKLIDYYIKLNLKINAYKSDSSNINYFDFSNNLYTFRNLTINQQSDYFNAINKSNFISNITDMELRASYNLIYNFVEGIK